ASLSSTRPALGSRVSCTTDLRDKPPLRPNLSMRTETRVGVGLLLFCLALPAAACESEPRPSADLVSAQQVQALGMKIWDAFSRLDAEGILARYADDAVIMPPGAPAVS